MLIRAAKPDFGSLHKAAKQLLIWSFSKKQDFHSTCQNDYNSTFFYKRRPNYRRKTYNFEVEEDNSINETPLELNNLKPFQKNFYTPHPDVLNRSESEVHSFYEQHDIHLFGNNTKKCPVPIFKFDELDLPKEAHDVIRRLKYTEPTPIQSQTWPIALSGFNMVGVAQTGSGKTLGFVLPGMIHIKNQPDLEDNEGPIAVVVSPTRELAQQTNSVCVPFASSFKFNTACVYGGSAKDYQIRKLSRAHICVGTPGRLIDFLRSGVLNLSRCTYFVLDEADRLLDMGFEPQIRAIMRRMRKDSQILMWSATWPRSIQNLAEDFLRDYIGVKFGSSELTINPNITQHIHVCDEREKLFLLQKLLKQILTEDDHKTLIFAQTKIGAERLARELYRNGYSVSTVHGDKSQLQRDRAVAAFRSGRTNVLIGTGVVGRGLDITDIRYVINYDFPQDIEDYVHIIGRTGRGNNLGTAHTFFTENDTKNATDLVKILKQSNQEIVPELQDLASSRHFSFGRHRSRPLR